MIEEKMIVLNDHDEDQDRRSVLTIEKPKARAILGPFLVRLEDQELVRGEWKGCHYIDGDHFVLNSKEARKLYGVLKEVFEPRPSVVANMTGESTTATKSRPLAEVFKGNPVERQAEEILSNLDPRENPPPGSPCDEPDDPTNLSESPECGCCFCVAQRRMDKLSLVGIGGGHLETLRNLQKDIEDIYWRMGIKSK